MMAAELSAEAILTAAGPSGSTSVASALVAGRLAAIAVPHREVGRLGLACSVVGHWPEAGRHLEH